LKKLLVVIGTAFAAATGTWPAQAAGYQYQLVDFPGMTGTQVFKTNNPGVAVGYAFNNVTVISFEYDVRKKAFAVVPDASGYGETDITAINNAGVMAGDVYSLDFVTESAIIRGKDGTFHVFRQPGWDNSEARGINEVGLVCGWSYSADRSSSEGFIYDPRNNTFTSVLPSPETIAGDINNRGQLVGSVYLLAGGAYAGSPEGRYGFVRDADGQVTLFSVNGQGTRARGITDAGVISGLLNDAVTGFKGFVTKLSRSSGYQAVSIPDANLLVIPPQFATEPEGIANNGVVSGFAADAAGNLHGFIATP
jgi:hypothetical protein